MVIGANQFLRKHPPPLELAGVENNDLENDDRDGVARRIKGLEGYRRRRIRGRWGIIIAGYCSI